MSRAFVDEDAGAGREQAIPPAKPPLPPGARNYMTPAGAARLVAEAQMLRRTRRPDLAAAAAADPGSGEAAHALQECDRRIQYLTQMQALLEVVEPGHSPGRVVFGTTVTVEQSQVGRRTFTIVGVDEAEPGTDRISWISPIARALMGARVGDTVPVTLPTGPGRMRVLEIG
jgi:transcription elongation factor GreB